MKQNLLLTFALFASLSLLKAQSNKLDSTFGTQGFVKTSIGSLYPYAKSADRLLATPDGKLYSISTANGNTIIGKINSNGLPDSTYGVNGFIIPLKLSVYGAGLTSDGKLVVEGYINQDGYDFFAGSIEILKFTPDGIPDTTFNHTGEVLENALDITGASLFKIQPDGKILAGYLFLSNSELNLQRFNQDGSLDLTFNQTGTVTFNDADINISSGLYIQDNGKIVIPGSSQLNPEFKRLNSDGTTDFTLNGTGQVNLDDSFGATINNWALQDDGKILAAGYASDNTGQTSFFVARFNVDGSLDTATFGQHGKQVTTFPGKNSVATTIGVENDGTIILGGYTFATDSDFAIASYDVNGVFQRKNTNDFNSGNDAPSSLVIQNDGTILLLGTTSTTGNPTKLAAALYDTNDKLDKSFSSNGKLTVPPHNIHLHGNTNFKSTAVQSDGKIIVAGSAWNGTTSDFALARYNTDGSLDNTFSGNGKKLTDIYSSADVANAVVIRNNGKIVVAGAYGSHLAIAWFNKNGSLYRKDTSQVFPPATSVALQPDGKLLVNCQSVLLRYDTAGVLDPGFGVNGQLQTPFDQAHPFICNSFAIEPDGKIIVMGQIAGPRTTYADFTIAKFNTDGSPDITFGTTGSVVYPDLAPFQVNGYYHAQVNAIKIQSDGKIVASGTLTSWYRSYNHDLFTGRFNADGSYDKDFESYEPNIPNLYNIQNFGTSLISQPDDKIIAGGYIYDGTNYNFAVIRYNTDGTIDHTFNNIGLTPTVGTYADNGVNALALSNDTLYAAGFGQYPDNLGVLARYKVVIGPSAIAVSHEITIAPAKFKVIAMPNPSQSFFHIVVMGSIPGIVTITVTDVSGRLMEIRSNMRSNSNIIIGDKLPAGVYFVQVRQGTNSSTLKLVKQ